jgi:hypothetical protein
MTRNRRRCADITFDKAWGAQQPYGDADGAAFL